MYSSFLGKINALAVFKFLLKHYGKGISKLLIAFLLRLAKLLSIYSIVEQDVLKTLFEMLNSRIDFLPTELLKGDKITG